MAFNLESIRRGKDVKPPRLFVYGVEGIGKTTFASCAPSPIFLQAEDGQGGLDLARFPKIEATSNVMEAIQALYEGEHDYQTLVLDSADWLEQIIMAELEKKHDAKELAYGKGAVMQAEKWREILAGFDALRNEKGMAIIVIGHTQVKRFDSPETEPYDRYQPQLQERSNAVLRQWADAVLFANYKTIVKKSDVGFNKEVSRGVTTGERLLYTTEKPAYMAKNRYALPDSIPFTWDALAEGINA